MTRLTPVLYFLFVGSVLVNIGVLPAESGVFNRSFAELGIIFNMFALRFEESTDNFVASVKRSWGIALFGALAMTATAVSLTTGQDSFTLASTLLIAGKAVALCLNILVPVCIGLWRPVYLREEAG